MQNSSHNLSSGPLSVDAIRRYGEAAQTTAWSRGPFPAGSCDLPTPDVPNLSLCRCHSWLGQCIWVCLKRSDQEKAQKGRHNTKNGGGGGVGAGRAQAGNPKTKESLVTWVTHLASAHGNVVWSRVTLSCLP